MRPEVQTVSVLRRPRQARPHQPDLQHACRRAVGTHSAVWQPAPTSLSHFQALSGVPQAHGGCSENGMLYQSGVGRGRRTRLSVATARRDRMNQTCSTRAAGPSARTAPFGSRRLPASVWINNLFCCGWPRCVTCCLESVHYRGNMSSWYSLTRRSPLKGKPRCRRKCAASWESVRDPFWNGMRTEKEYGSGGLDVTLPRMCIMPCFLLRLRQTAASRK